MTLWRNTPFIITSLILMSCIGIGLGVWLFRGGFIVLGCIEIGVWLWNAQRFALWLLIPPKISASREPSGMAQRLLLALICLAAAGISSWGIYWWYLSPADWQAGLAFILFGLVILMFITKKEVQVRKA